MIDNYKLYGNLPSLDLHGETRFSSIVMLREFINNNKKLSNKSLQCFAAFSHHRFPNPISSKKSTAAPDIPKQQSFSSYTI